MTKIFRDLVKSINPKLDEIQLDEAEKEFHEEMKSLADPECKICEGTGFIIRGWAKGFICGCVPEPF